MNKFFSLFFLFMVLIFLKPISALDSETAITSCCDGETMIVSWGDAQTEFWSANPTNQTVQYAGGGKIVREKVCGEYCEIFLLFCLAVIVFAAYAIHRWRKIIKRK